MKRLITYLSTCDTSTLDTCNNWLFAALILAMIGASAATFIQLCCLYP